MQTRTYALGAAGALALFVGGAFLLTEVLRPADRFAACRQGQAGGDIGGDFTLVNGAGETVTRDEVVQEPTLIYFGFTFCPDVCPIDNLRNAQAVELLEAEGIAATPVFISVDPARDTPERMGDYVANFHERMIGLTGSPDQVKAAADAYRVFYQAHDDEDPEYYTVDHTVMTYLELPGEGVVDFFRRDASPDRIARTVQCYAEAA